MNAEQSYIFRHAIIRDAAYQLQLPGDRSRLHGVALEVIETLCGGRPPAQPSPVAFGHDAVLPHPSDSLARELAEHARLSGTADSRAAQLVYLHRAAEHEARLFQDEASQALWLRYAELTGGVEQASALLRAGMMADRSGRPRQAAPLYEKALARFRKSGARALEGRTLERMAALDWSLGRTEDALRGYTAALEIFRETADSQAARAALVNIAMVYHGTGRLAEAEKTWREALRLHKEKGDRRAEGITLANLANLFQTRGHSEKAEPLFEEAIAISREAGDLRSEGIAVGNLANVYMGTGRDSQGEEGYRRALAIHRQVGNRRFEGIALSNLAGLYLGAGRVKEAEQGFEEALTIHREVDNRRSIGVALGGLAGVYSKSGRAGLAERTYQRALAIHREMGATEFEGTHRCDYSLHLVAEGRLEEASDQWRQGVALLRKFGDLREIEGKTVFMKMACARAGVPLFEETLA